MRVRTSVAVVFGVVVAKAALTWLEVEGWGSLPHRPGFVGHWRIQLNTFGEWFAALATAAAVRVALYIAWKDRHDRISERHDEQKRTLDCAAIGRHGEQQGGCRCSGAQFRSVARYRHRPCRFHEHPKARWIPLNSHWQARGLSAHSTHRPILMPSKVSRTLSTHWPTS